MHTFRNTHIPEYSPRPIGYEIILSWSFLPVKKLSAVKFVLVNAIHNEIVLFDSRYFAPKSEVGEFVVDLGDH